ncbi:MAG: co-chaperone GroES [Nitrososphaerales archaeon]
MSRKVQPLFNRVLIKRQEAAETTEGGLIVPEAAKELPLEGTVIAVGEDVRKVKAHDEVMFSKYAGTEVEIDDEKLLLLSEEDILAIVE